MASSSPRPRSDAVHPKSWVRSDTSSKTPTDSSPRSIFARAAWCAESDDCHPLFKREDAVVLAALFLLLLRAWLATLIGAGTGMDPFAMSGWRAPAPPPATGTAWYWLIVFLMWV